jgi:hypothetical protein
MAGLRKGVRNHALGSRGRRKWRRSGRRTPFGFRCSSSFANFFEVDGVRTRAVPLSQRPPSVQRQVAAGKDRRLTSQPEVRERRAKFCRRVGAGQRWAENGAAGAARPRAPTTESQNRPPPSLIWPSGTKPTSCRFMAQSAKTGAGPLVETLTRRVYHDAGKAKFHTEA